MINNTVNNIKTVKKQSGWHTDDEIKRPTLTTTSPGRTIFQTGGFESQFEDSNSVVMDSDFLDVFEKPTSNLFQEKEANVPRTPVVQTFDFNQWLTTQIRANQCPIKADVADIVENKRPPRTRLQQTFRCTKCRIRPVPYIHKITSCNERQGHVSKSITHCLDLDKLIDFQEAKDEADYRAQIKTIRLGKTVIKHIIDVNNLFYNKDTVVKLSRELRFMFQSRLKDPLQQALIFLPDQYNYDNEEQSFLKDVVRPIIKEIASEEIILDIPEAQYSLTLTAGCNSEINGFPVGDPSSCILLNEDDFDSIHSKIKKIEGCISVAKIPPEEIKRYFELFGVSLPETCYHLYFSNQDFCLKARKFKKDMMPYLLKSKKPSIDVHPQSELILDMKWYVRPFKGRGKIIITNPKEIRFAQEVLSAHGINASFFPSNNSDNELEINWIGSRKEAPAHNENALEEVVHRAMSANNIKYEKMYFFRSAEFRLEKQNIVQAIHKRLVKAAINSGVWDKDTPIEPDDWTKLFENAEELPWYVHVAADTYRHDEIVYEGNARVIFTEKLSMAENILKFLVERSPDKDTFSLNPADKLGVRFYPSYRKFRYIPVTIRGACHVKIQELDHYFRTEESTDHLKWLRICDTVTKNDECRIAVEGWPISDVIHASEILAQVFRGTSIDCSLGNRYCLFSAFGEAWIHKMNEKFFGTVVCIVDRINKIITLYGSDEDVDLFKNNLLSFVDNWHYFNIDVAIAVDFPRYLPSLRKIIHRFPDYFIEDLIGGGRLSVSYPDTIYSFKGQIYQYICLINLLESIQAKMEDKFAPGHSFRPICPICFMKVDNFSSFQLDLCGHHYCLECLTHMISTAIRCRQLPLKCCAIDCATDICIQDITYLFTGHIKVPSSFFYEKFKPFVRSVVDVVLLLNPHLKPCSTPDCMGIHQVSDRRDKVVSCSQCGVKRCGRCCEAPHEEYSCEEYKKLYNDSELSINLFKKNRGQVVRDCPNEKCRAVIEKDAGCNHMQCHYCKIHFCWLCEFTSNQQKDVYIHLNEKHGGTGGGWRIENNVLVDFPEDVMDEVLLAVLLENGDI